MIAVGYTGTRVGMSPEQFANVTAIVLSLARVGHSTVLAHHGDCVGGDAQFHEIVRARAPRGGHITIHPGPVSDVANQAGCVGDERRSPKSHLRRNDDIVDEAHLMIAAPLDEMTPSLGGTWRTILYARKIARPLVIAWRAGYLGYERWPANAPRVVV